MRKWIVPLLAVFISLASVVFSPNAVYAAPSDYGVDSSNPVSNGAVEEANKFLEVVKASFWGRYFEGPYAGNCTDEAGFTSIEYDPSSENPVLHSKGIALLPVGSSTKDVGGSSACGQKDGQVQAQSLLKDLGEEYLAKQGSGEFYIFLDVEQDTPLSPQYYEGWSKAIQAASSKVKLLPGVYMSVADSSSANNLNQAIDSGATCAGLWIAGYPYPQGWKANYLPKWNQGEEATPITKVNAPVLLWQFAQNVEQKFDLDMLNPAYASQTLKRLPIPPAS